MNVIINTYWFSSSIKNNNIYKGIKSTYSKKMDLDSPKDKVLIRIIDILKSNPQGMSIADIIKKTKLARHTVLARLHVLIGKGDINVRTVNMAKLHYWTGHTEPPEEAKHVKVVPLAESHIKKAESSKPKIRLKINMDMIRSEIEHELKTGKIEKHEAQFKEQRLPIAKVVQETKERPKQVTKDRVATGIEGLDALFDEGIPRGASLLVAGGAGSGKTLLCLQIAAHHAAQGKKCLYMSFEESEERLKQHMNDFGWDPDKLEKQGNLKIQRFNPFDITRSVDALLMKAKGELLIDVDPVILPQHFKPDFVFVDSLTAIASAFVAKEDSYRIYIEQLFRFFEKIGATSFMITETRQIPTTFSTTGVEEFLADGVLVLYNIKRGNVRERAVEVLKLRGAHHEKRIVAFEIADKGIVIYPEQEIFGGLEEQREEQ